jgi:hypothetical protein
MICNRSLLILIIMMFGIIASGCGIGLSGGRINFNDLKYPVSMISSLYGPDGEIVKEDGKLRVVKVFVYAKYYWSTFYSMIPFSRTSDIIDRINEEIKEAGGDGITSVSISSDYSKLTSAFPLKHTSDMARLL